ncbi:MAG: hypothetical protein ABGZ17_29625, partial [Planctomycetaceae bacterium]
ATIAISASVRKRLPWPTLHALARRADATGVELREIPDAGGQTANAFKAATVSSVDRTVEWAVFDKDALVPGPDWGTGDLKSPVVRQNHNDASMSTGKLLSLAVVESERPNQCSVFSANGELDGSVSEFGKRFWEQLTGVSPWLKEGMESGPPRSVEYTDRYLKSPLSARLLYEVLQQLVSGENSATQTTQVRLNTMKATEKQTGRHLHHNWSNYRVQESTLKSIFRSLGKPSIRLLARDKLAHARCMRIEWRNGLSAAITLDQGMGFARCVGTVDHHFRDAPELQANALISCAFAIQQSDHKVPFYVMRGN